MGKGHSLYGMDLVRPGPLYETGTPVTVMSPLEGTGGRSHSLT